MTYEDLLDKAKQELPDEIVQESRFEIPNVKGHVEGNKTIIANFHDIADKLGRDPEHLLKYVLHEIASPGEIVQNRVVIGAKVSASRINEKITYYAEEYVFCKECGKPDTELQIDDDVTILKCNACGARQSVYGSV